MGHVHRGFAKSRVQERQLGTHVAAQLGIQIGKRFIKQKNLGLAHDGAANGHALALAAGELFGFAVQQVFDIEHLGGGGHFGVNVSHGSPSQTQGKRHVLRYVHVRVQRVILKHHGDVARHGVYVGHVAPTDQHAAFGHLL